MHDIGPVWDDEVLADPEVQAAIRDNGTVRREYIVTNQDRSALGRIGGAVARVHGVFSKLHRQAPTEQTLSNALAGVYPSFPTPRSRALVHLTRTCHGLPGALLQRA